jgi:hypothetical protein
LQHQRARGNSKHKWLNHEQAQQTPRTPAPIDEEATEPGGVDEACEELAAPRLIPTG